MKSRFRMKLTVVMIIFAMALSVAIALMDHYRLKDQARLGKAEQVRKSEQTVKYALESMEKAYYVLGENIAAKMRDSTVYLLNKYENDPSVSGWDLEALKKELTYDIHIIDENDVIAYSSLRDEVGLDFKACCGKLAAILKERRSTGEFYHDGIDIEQNTGILKKYSYMATPDKKIIFQLGYTLQDSMIYQHFNFFQAINELVAQDDSFYEINVLNMGGHALGELADASKLSGPRRDAFEKTFSTGQTSEFRGDWYGLPAIYRYVNYDSKYDSGSTQTKVLEMIYNDKDLQAFLQENRRTFIVQLIAVLFVTVVLALIISRWVARPMHLAFHDSLTGLHNRAAFEELLESMLADNRDTLALLMIDLDNFKSVNDDHGHDAGDLLLKRVAHSIRSVLRKGDAAVRLGGDEFVILMPSASNEEAEHTAVQLIEAVREPIKRHSPLEKASISVSIGISLAPHDGIDVETLCKRADTALYVSKELGKNRYSFYSWQAADRRQNAARPL